MINIYVVLTINIMKLVKDVFKILKVVKYNNNIIV